MEALGLLVVVVVVAACLLVLPAYAMGLLVLAATTRHKGQPDPITEELDRVLAELMAAGDQGRPRDREPRR